MLPFQAMQPSWGPPQYNSGWGKGWDNGTKGWGKGKGRWNGNSWNEPTLFQSLASCAALATAATGLLAAFDSSDKPYLYKFLKIVQDPFSKVKSVWKAVKKDAAEEEDKEKKEEGRKEIEIQPAKIEQDGRREKKEEQDRREAAFIEFDTSRPFLFEGETVPATVQLFLWNGLPVTQIEQAPVKDGDSFSITELRQPNQRRNVLRNGKTYNVFSWSIGLTAAMAGEHKLSFSTAIRVRVSNRRNNPFNNPIFNDPFFGFGREEGITVQGNEMTMEVRSLPMKGRPLGFQGAIGTFTSESRIDTERVSMGDPVRLVFEISGTGNFAAVPAPEINSNQKFKIGPPSFSFEGNQITKHEGKQSFEYIVTPLVAGLHEIPPIEFSYFDPIQESFVSASTLPHPLQVDRGEQWNPGVQGSNYPKQTVESNRPPVSDLFQAESEPGEWTATLTPSPLMNQPAFWYFQAIPFAGICSLTFWGIRRKTRGKEKFKAKENSLSRQMKDAVGFNDASSLLRAFRDLLRLKIARIHKYPNPSSLASDELIALLKAGKNSDEVISAVKELLRNCDDQEFAGNELARQPVEDLYREGSAILKKIR